MKFRLLVTFALLTLLTPTICSATPPRPGPYVSGFAGVAIPTRTTSDAPTGLNDRIEFDPGVNIGGTGGFDFGYLRFEGEISYKHGEMRTVVDRANALRFDDVDGRIAALAMMGNIFLDMHNPGPITPYFGGGAGFAALHQSDTFSLGGTRLYRADDDAVFAYQVGAGLEIALNRMISLDLAYRYFATSKATFNADTVEENRLRFETHNVSAGVRVKF